MTTAATELAASAMPQGKTPSPSKTNRVPAPGDPLTASGLRITRPRRAIADILFKNSYHHFTAEEVMATAQETGQRLSLATVYNTLNDFAAHGLVRRLATAGGPAQFDTGPGDHHHFHVEADNRVIDIPPDQIAFTRIPVPPPGYRVVNIDVVIRIERSEKRNEDDP